MDEELVTPNLEPHVYCLACNSYVYATACTIKDEKFIICPKCGKDICNE